MEFAFSFQMKKESSTVRHWTKVGRLTNFYSLTFSIKTVGEHASPGWFHTGTGGESNLDFGLPVASLRPLGETMRNKNIIS